MAHHFEALQAREAVSLPDFAVPARARRSGTPHLALACAGGSDFSVVPVTRPGDAVETEADRGASAALSGHSPAISAPGPAVRSGSSPGLAGGGRALPPAVRRESPASRGMAGQGRPLDAETRSRAEASFGVPLGQVRVHDGREGQALAGAHSARAVTVGTDIAFNRGFYRPSTHTGQRLLAHELAHVVQQSGAASGTSSGAHHEVAADSAAAELMARRDARSLLGAGAPVGPQCQTMTAQEIEKLDSGHVKVRLAFNAHERQVIVYSEAYQAELAREQVLLESRARQITDRAAIFREVQEELAEVDALVTKMATDVAAHPADYAMNEVRGIAMRLEFDMEYAATLAAGLGGEQRRQLQLMVQRYSGLLVTHTPAVRSAESWHAANPMGESLEMTNERAGTYTAGVATRHWDKGGWYYFSGAGAYLLTAGVAVVEAAETVASFGFHGTATAVAKAYAQGDISWNEGKDLLVDAAAQALLKAAITRGLGAATSRIGLAGARGLGLAARPLVVRVAYGAAVGGIGGAADLGLQHGVTALIRSHFHSPTARAITDLGRPTGTQWAIAIPLSALLGGAGGLPNKPIRFGNKELVGSTLDTPVGRMKVAAVTKEGNVVLQPASAAKAPPPPPPTQIDLFYNPQTGTWEIPGPTSGAMVPAKTGTTPSTGLGPIKGGGGTPKLIGPPPPQLLAPPSTFKSPPIVGAEEVQLSQADYEAALSLVYPSMHTSWVARVVDEVGARAAQRAMQNPRFVAALTTGNMTLAGTFFHSAAAVEIRALPTNALPPGWSITAEEVIQSGAGGSRTDVLLRGPNGALLEFDWKTTGRSGLSSGSRSEMARHAGQIRLHIGGRLQTQQTVSWMDYVRSLMSP